jgi:hypothetical protein
MNQCHDDEKKIPPSFTTHYAEDSSQSRTVLAIFEVHKPLCSANNIDDRRNTP